MSENEIILPEVEKFLFLFPVRKVSRKFCCCSYRLGVLITSLIFIALNVCLIVMNTSNYYSHHAGFRIAIDIIRIIGSILLLVSLKTKNYKYATYTYWMFALLFYFHVILNLIILYWITFHFHHYSILDKAMSWSVILGFLAFECWLVWIIFSYTKLLKHEQTDIINKGKITFDDPSYKNIEASELSTKI
jgi:hypothetical protein